MSNNKSVYLAGPITGLTYQDADEWRDKACEFLAHHYIDGLSPMRGKQYLRALGRLSASCQQEGALGVLSTPKAIMTRDFRDVMTSDCLLVNFLGATKISVGTVMEIAWAYQLHKPVVVCMEETGNPHEHAMLGEATGFRVPSVEEGLAVVCCILKPQHT